ncbi:hypothetical protein DEU39_3880 [Chryseobacterium sp. AG363]|nr:hypothetical protein DEU39_3880 [Chryseobacterium sp. AG363]
MLYLIYDNTPIVVPNSPPVEGCQKFKEFLTGWFKKAGSHKKTACSTTNYTRSF